jgi:hypothetical protein
MTIEFVGSGEDTRKHVLDLPEDVDESASSGFEVKLGGISTIE